MVARTLFAIDSEALTVIFSTTQNVGDTVFNNSSSPDGTQYAFGSGFSARQVTVEDTGGNSETLEDDNENQHIVTDGAGLVENGTPIEAESVIQLQEMGPDGTLTGPVINIYVLSKDGVTSDVWGFASDTILVPGTNYSKVGGNNIGSTDYANYQSPWLVTVDGTGGNDVMDVGYSDAEGDQIDGQDGTNEDIYGYYGDDSINAGVGHDRVFGGQGNDTLAGGSGSDTLDGGYGTDRADYGASRDAVTVDLATGTGSGGDAEGDRLSSIENLTGSRFGDDLTGDHNANAIDGGDGNDTVRGGAGDDTLHGDGGDDLLDGGADDDLMFGDDGTDTVAGGDGNDTLYGGAGDDSLSGNDGNDVLVGDEGTDTLLGGGGDDILMGGEGDDSLSGGDGDDILVGGDGADTLNGEAGDDTLVGGLGADTFVIEKADFSALGTPEDVSEAIVRANLANLTGWSAKKNYDPVPDENDNFEASTLDISAIGAAVRDAAPSSLDPLSLNSLVLLVETELTALVLDDPGAFLEAGDVGKTIKNIIKPVFGNKAAMRVEDAVEGDINRQYDELENLLTPPTVSAQDILGLAQDVTIQDFEIGTDSLDLSSHDYLGGNGLSTNDVKITGSNGNGDAKLTLPDGSTITLIGVDPATLDPEMLESMGFQPSDDTSDFQNELLAASGRIFGGGGDDELGGSDGAETISGGTGNDSVFGGGGADTIFGGSGSDYIEGGEGDDVLYTGIGDDTLDGGDGDDVLNNSSGDDSLVGGAGNDKLVASSGDDTLEGGADNDTLIGGIDDDSLDGGSGDDTLMGDFEVSGLVEPNLLFAYEYYELDSAGSLNSLADAGFTSGTENDSPPDGEGVVQTIDPAGIDTFHGGNGDTFAIKLTTTLTVTNAGTYTFDLTSDDGAQIYIDGVLLADNDGAHTETTISGGTTLASGEHLVEILYFDQSGTETLSVDLSGPDTGNVPIGLETANLSTSFDDVLIGGTGDDLITGGLGDDTFVYNVGDGADTITDFNSGNTGTLSDDDATNNDFIDLSGYYDNLSELYADQADDGVLNQSNDGVDGVDYSDNSDFGAGSLTFTGASSDASFYTAENTGVVCFTSGTAILTPRGDVLIDDLQIGDLVCTLDHEPQPIRWIGRRDVGPDELEADEKLRPVLIPKGMFGAQRDFLVSRQHALLIDPARLARAIHLAKTNGLPARIANGKKKVTYIHLMFDRHQIIFAENVASESFYPGLNALELLGPDTLAELTDIFPAFAAAANPEEIARIYGPTARPIVKRTEIAAARCRTMSSRQITLKTLITGHSTTALPRGTARQMRVVTAALSRSVGY